jgi:hypothetical protein
MLLLRFHAADETPAFALHVTHERSGYLGDKSTNSDCEKIPCATMIITVEARSMQTDFVLQ